MRWCFYRRMGGQWVAVTRYAVDTPVHRWQVVETRSPLWRILWDRFLELVGR